jgi:hypothetical protein
MKKDVMQHHKLRKVITLDPDIHHQIEAFFKEQGVKFNLSEAVRDVEKGLLASLIKQKELSGLEKVAPLLRAKASAGLIIADAFQNLIIDLDAKQ